MYWVFTKLRSSFKPVVKMSQSCSTKYICSDKSGSELMPSLNVVWCIFATLGEKTGIKISRLEIPFKG